MDWLFYILLALVALCGLLLNLFSLPGNWVMILFAALYGWLTGWNYVGWKWLTALGVIALAAEGIEMWAGGAGAKKAGGGVWGIVGAIVGALVGGILLTGLIPIPVIGTVLGILLGTFLGATGAEMLAGKDADRSILIGAGAAKGRFYGTLIKLGFGCVLLILCLVAALPLGGRARAATPAVPSTLPASTQP